jgi:hypothetical protein
MALVDEKMGQTPVGPRQGLANYVLYPLALAQETAGTVCNASTTPLPNSACVFNDVTVGNNSVPGESGYPDGLYSSGVSYDLASGLGSVNVANLVNAWASATFRPTTTTLTLNGGTAAISITHGTPVNVGISVAPNSGSGTPTGDVALIAMTDPSETEISDQVAVAAFTLNASGTISGTTSLLPGNGSVSPYFVTAHYSGNVTSTPTGVFAPSDSSPGVLVTVTPENSTTTVSGVNQNLNSISGGTFPFGTFIFVRVDVAGSSGQGVPTGQVNFEDTFGNLPGQLFYPVLNPVPLNSQGNTSIGAGVINFDAGNHSISATYEGDASFNSSQSSQLVTFTVQPGFAADKAFGGSEIRKYLARSASDPKTLFSQDAQQTLF